MHLYLITLLLPGRFLLVLPRTPVNRPVLLQEETQTQLSLYLIVLLVPINLYLSCSKNFHYWSIKYKSEMPYEDRGCSLFILSWRTFNRCWRTNCTILYTSFRIKFPYRNAFEMLDLNDVTKMRSWIRAVNLVFLDQCFMFDCYKYMDISGSGLEANVCSLSEGF